MKQSWSILNQLLGRGRKKSTLCEYVIKNNVQVYDDKAIANAFNGFNINVGPSLANDIDSNNVDMNYNQFV